MIIYDTKYTNIMVFVQCTESLKHGIIHGVWLDLTLDLEDLKMQIADMLAASLFANKTHWCFTYFESPLLLRFLDSSRTLKHLHEMACFIEQFQEGNFGAQLLDRYWGNVEEAKDTIENQYMGDFKNIADFVTTYLKAHTKTPQCVIDTVNTKKLWEDWRKDKFFVISTPPHGVQIFRKTWGPVVLE